MPRFHLSILECPALVGWGGGWGEEARVHLFVLPSGDKAETRGREDLVCRFLIIAGLIFNIAGLF